MIDSPTRKARLQDLASFPAIGDAPENNALAQADLMWLRLKGSMLESFAYTIRAGAWSQDDQAMEDKLHQWFNDRASKRDL